MNASIVFDSRAGTTRAAASAMARVLEHEGHRCRLWSVADADPARVAAADLICVGSGTQGLFPVHATPASMRFIDRLGDLRGKKAVVFCTYKIATGSLLPRMAAALESRGAEVVGRFRFRGPAPTEDFLAFAASLAPSARARSASELRDERQESGRR